MKKIMFSAIALLSFATYAQEETTSTEAAVSTSTDTPAEKTWTRAGIISLLFNQAAFNHDWTGGGTNNYGGNLNLSYDANYKKGLWTWDNKLLIDYGLTRVDGDAFSKKTNDRFAITSLLGAQTKEDSQWYYSFFANFQTQLDKGYKYGTDAQGNQTRTEYTHFMAPGYFSFGPGMLWKKSDNLKVNIAPATSKITTARKQFTSPTGSHYTHNFYGVEDGKNIRYELGFYLNGYAKVDVWENVSIENILSLYSNYLDKPQNVDLDYTANVVMKVNKFLSANFTFQAIYDDDAARAFQIRELLGLGLSYKF